ncbi:MAG: hypothetical protein E7L01_26700 [Paenibacillus macerans]|uniref:Uncharacterized protein n=1 Tax=Paenibacillus macerans TaxID=44252 RepID=A0A6N8ERS8_PAEMA|nr:hypothetical protein [Paenibacillus macerans]MDU7476903.1 hypothetical protein [Paenibacillus macerans]MUG22345.1 hypothetical protein [Paenibacillus macerans]UMV49109.1 hypothetical protein LMZ02_07050 [Paenibacillus macerans]
MLKKKYTKYTLLLIVVLFAVGIMWFFNSIPQNTSFNDLVLNHIKVSEIASIDILKFSRESSNVEEEIKVEDDNIGKIISDFSTIKLRKVSSVDVNPYRTYQLSIRTNQDNRFKINLYEEDYMEIYDAKKKELGSYKIISDYNVETIQTLFQK